MFSFLNAFDPLLILICCGGTLFGIAWGAMPALSTSAVMALLVGLTYGMGSEVAIAFMLGTLRIRIWWIDLCHTDQHSGDTRQGPNPVGRTSPREKRTGRPSARTGYHRLHDW
jgi:hypothetical protein